MLVRSAYARVLGYETLVKDSEWGARRAECEVCPHLEGGQCRICTCFVDAKALLALEQCPVKKWRRIWRKRIVNDKMSKN